jgi:hypothetical protein
MVAFTAGTTLAAAALNSAFNELVVNAQTGTSYPLVLTDRGGLVTLNNANPVTVTVPAYATVAYANGTQIGLLQIGAGQVTVAPAGGVTIVSFNSANKIVGQGGLAVLIKIATNTWYLSGGITA